MIPLYGSECNRCQPKIDVGSMLHALTPGGRAACYRVISRTSRQTAGSTGTPRGRSDFALDHHPFGVGTFRSILRPVSNDEGVWRAAITATL